MKYLRLGFFISFLAVMGIFTFIAVWFALPRERKISLGPVENYPPAESPYVINLDSGTAYLYSSEDKIRIFDRHNPSPNGCVIRWWDEEAAYIDPCTGSQYWIDGSNKRGPTTNDLKEMKVEVVEGVVWVYLQVILQK